MTDLLFQSFDAATRPEDGPPRLAALRARMAEAGLDAFIIPHADRFQGEYVAARDERLAFLTGFSGSAGLAVVTADEAGVFVDGRYRVQVRNEVDTGHFTPVNWPETQPADWLAERAGRRAVLGFDPWLHTEAEIDALRKRLDGAGVKLRAVENPLDAIWEERPEAPHGEVRLHAEHIAGRTAAEKRGQIAAILRDENQGAAVITLCDSLAWLLNIRGDDLLRNPLVQGYAIIDDDGGVQVFAAPEKFGAEVRGALGAEVRIAPLEAFEDALKGLAGTVRVDPKTAPQAVFDLLSGAEIARADDPIIMEKAVKNVAEIAGMRAAHLRDGAAMVRLLAWLSAQPPASLTEIDVVRKLEALRREAGAYNISFDTISGSGPNGAIVHYRVSEASNRAIGADDILLLDSGGQYADGTTDITRTIAMGTPEAEAQAAFTRVLEGMIALSRLRFPKGLSGRDIDAVARAPLWTEGRDYDHGTGHGVGAALCVHEGPARISRASEVPLRAGMILSNEPGYYRRGAFGIRIENLVVVSKAEAEPGREMLGFETLTFVPIDRRMILPELLPGAARDWLDQYHAETEARLAPMLDGPADKEARAWLTAACAPL
ncbi:MAG: aminopeptidase P family protein [Paracoccus sp. (in: a-proteobacteria)]|nr:aminopeptidase P family protein [Paracoccus sp. (in: a-proteobacteria)]